MRNAKGYFGLTDHSWYSFLAAQPQVDEVNFWKPRGSHGFRAIQQGEPFFFKLRAPQKAIAGFGFFERFARLRAWEAWKHFGPMNGAANLDGMIAQIAAIRRDDDTPARRAGDFEIGCIIVTAPIFFPEEEWVAPPRDWAKTGIQEGKSYELASGEGHRVLADCIQQAQSAARYWNVEPVPLVAEASARYGTPLLVRPRLGQGTFSLAVRDAYGGACAVTHEHSTPVLEAAHIRPYSRGGVHRIDNGLLLRSDLHLLYDHGYVTVTPDYVFRVGDRLRDEYKNGRTYYGLDRTRITVPSDTRWHPNRELLDWHGQSVFKG